MTTKSKLLDVVEGINLNTGKDVSGRSKKAKLKTPLDMYVKEEEMGEEAFIVEHQSWERQPGEPLKWYEAFKLFRDMGWNRSLRGVVKKMKEDNIPGGPVNQMCEKWSWYSRADTFDVWDEHQRREIQREAYRDMQDRHVKEAKMIQAKLIERLGSLSAVELSPGEVIKWLEVSTRIERMAMGDTRDLVKAEDEPDSNQGGARIVKDLTNAELETIGRVLKEQKERASAVTVEGDVSTEGNTKALGDGVQP